MKMLLLAALDQRSSFVKSVFVCRLSGVVIKIVCFSGIAVDVCLIRLMSRQQPVAILVTFPLEFIFLLIGGGKGLLTSNRISHNEK